MAHQQRSVPATPPESEMLDLTGSRIAATAKKLQALLRDENCPVQEGVGALAMLLNSVLSTCSQTAPVALLRHDLEHLIAVCHKLETGQ